MKNKGALGAWGEAVAADFLRKKRYRIVAMNYHCRYGEIDIIAQNKVYLAFVEVKMRASSTFAEAREFVDPHKQQRLLTSAKLWLSENETDLQPRFDVIEIYAPEGADTKKPIISHIEDAFS